MKKIFSIMAMMIAVSVIVSSCKPVEPEEPEYSYRVATYAAEWSSGTDQWVYTYDATGKVTGIIRNWVVDNNPVLDKEWDFAWAYPNLTISGSNNYQITFGSNGYVSSMTESGDGWAETYTYTYDSNGYLVSVSRDGELRSEIVIENGNIKTWSRLSDGVWQVKNHTYSTVENEYGIYNIYSERAGAGRWLMELGYFGKPCKNLCATNQWAHSDKGSTMQYDFDTTNNTIVRVIKTYDGEDEISHYTWESYEVL